MPVSFNFGNAILLLKQGKLVMRRGWNGKGMWLVWIEDWQTSHQQAGAFEVAPFIAMKTADNKLVPWLASQTDMAAEDWTEA